MNQPAPFNKKQMRYIARSFDSWFNVLEGGKRGSKNVVNTYAFCLNLETHPDKFHLIAGVDQSSPRINIGDCDGFGLFNFFEGRCRKGKYESKDCYYIQTKAGEKVIFFAGGKKQGSENDIRGYTYGSVYVTEANQCCKTFLQECMDRTLSSKRRKVFHDLNPKGADDWYYTEILDFHEKKQKENSDYGYNYAHTTIVDNMSISDEKIREVLNTYDKTSVYYQREIKGLRAIAEGLCFPYFANNPKLYLIDDDYIKEKKIRLSHLIIGVDFGDNGSKYSFTCTGFHDNWRNLIVLDEWSIPKGTAISTDVLCKEFGRFYKLMLDKWGVPDWIFCDSASNTLINTLRAYCNANGLPSEHIAGVKKNEISERPKMIDVLLVGGRLKIHERCINLITALRSLVWDDKNPDVPQDENKNNINDYYDSFCYTFITHEKYINLRR